MENSGAKMTNEPASGLSPLEAEVIQWFINVARALRLPRSVAEIYGLLFVSPVPLNQPELEQRLRISVGSTSMGLKILDELGAVRSVKLPDKRRTHYEAVAELRNLAGNFVRQQISPHLSDSGTRLDRITEQAQALTGEAKAHAIARSKLLRSWNRNASLLLPVVQKLLGGLNGKS